MLWCRMHDSTTGRVEGGWDAAREGLAQRYRDGGYPDMATFIETKE
jgi:hypothetical protein